MKNIHLSRELSHLIEGENDTRIIRNASVFFAYFRDDCNICGLSIDFSIGKHEQKRIFSLYFKDVICVSTVLFSDHRQAVCSWLSSPVDICFYAEENGDISVELLLSGTDVCEMRFYCIGILDESTNEFASFFRSNRSY